jgi:hypothetical protein
MDLVNKEKQKDMLQIVTFIYLIDHVITNGSKAGAKRRLGFIVFWGVCLG